MGRHRSTSPVSPPSTTPPRTQLIPSSTLVDEHVGRGGSYWAAAQVDTTEQLVLVFDQPQSVTRLVYEVEEAHSERTQEVHVEASTDAGRSALVQEYTLSPHGSTFQREDLRLDLLQPHPTAAHRRTGQARYRAGHSHVAAPVCLSAA